MTSNVKRVMDMIDEVIAKSGQDAADVWAILTALRGPDKWIDYPLKKTHTVNIRYAVLPKSAMALNLSPSEPFIPFPGRRYPSMTRPGDANYAAPEELPTLSEVPHTPPSEIENHFAVHVNMAIEALRRIDR